MHQLFTQYYEELRVSEANSTHKEARNIDVRSYILVILYEILYNAQ